MLVTRNSTDHQTDKPQTDSALILLTLSITAPFCGNLKLHKATQKGKQGFEVTPWNQI